MLAFCSEPSRYARRVRAGRSLTFHVLGDPHNALAHHLIDEGIVPDLLVVDRFDRERTLRNQAPGNVPPATWQFFARHPYMSKYQKGVVQPCVAIVRGSKGDADRSVPYACAINELRVRNGMGAGDRPRAHDVWAALVAHEASRTMPRATMDASRISRHTLRDEPYVQVLLFAHAAVGAALLLQAAGIIAVPARNALLVCALAFALARWRAFFCGVVAQKWAARGRRNSSPRAGGGLAERLFVGPRFMVALLIAKLSELLGHLGGSTGGGLTLQTAPPPQTQQSEHSEQNEQNKVNEQGGCHT